MISKEQLDRLEYDIRIAVKFDRNYNAVSHGLLKDLIAAAREVQALQDQFLILQCEADCQASDLANAKSELKIKSDSFDQLSEVLHAKETELAKVKAELEELRALIVKIRAISTGED